MDRAEPDDVRQGLAWYSTVHQKCLKLAGETGYSLEQCAGVVAVLSPMVEWNLNMRTATRFLKAKGKLTSVPGFARNKRKARQVLKGDLGVIRGPKVKAFFETIIDPNHLEPVIDTQMLAAFYEGVAYRDDLKWAMTKKRLAPVRAAVKNIAERKGWRISEAQAIIWVTWKRLNSEYADQLKLWR